jgi:signal transduction histidine kinase
MVSHEFRTPLGIIASSAEILDAYLDRLSRDERKSNLQDITEATRHMARMMEQVLLLGRVEAGKLACRVAPLDLVVFCQRLVDEVKAHTNNRCPIHFTAAPELGGAQADEGLLRHIFTNLLSNASKYSAAGRIVEFQVESRGPLALFTVRDRGIGIPEADARLLFQAFHRGRNVGDIPGTGLGMVIVKHCVQLHGGKIAFESKIGVGTSFVVALPVFGVAGEDGNGTTQLFHKVAADQNLTLVL